jgi:hypothetical protein
MHRADRYQTAEEMRDAIEEVLAGRDTAVFPAQPVPPVAVRHTPQPLPRGLRKERPVPRLRIRRPLRAMVLLAAAVCTYVITGSHAPARSPVGALSLIGETMSEARSSAQAVGVGIQPIRYRVCHRPGTPVGRVCEQTPSPGSQVGPS